MYTKDYFLDYFWGRPEMSTFLTYEITSHNFLAPCPPLPLRGVYIFHVSNAMKRQCYFTVGFSLYGYQ